MKVNYKKLKELNKIRVKERYSYTFYIAERFSLIKELLGNFFKGIISLLIVVFGLVLIPIQLILIPIKRVILPIFYNIRLRLRLFFKKKKYTELLEKYKNKADWIE
ncbi:MAG: hypothetical protein ACOCRX_04780 [Candidatus Woesearchaeota archaeon]